MLSRKTGRVFVSQKLDEILEKYQCLDVIEDISEVQTHLEGAEIAEKVRLASSKWHFM